MTSILIIVMLVAMLGAFAAMIGMWVNGFRAGDAPLFLTTSAVIASYNSKLLRIFLACFLVALATMVMFIDVFSTMTAYGQVFGRRRR